jgi:4-hydroxythreonine-4-phosphate dehydrogenase
VRYVEQATRLALDREVSAIVTLPINKEAARMDRPDFTGHTELIADLCGKHDYTMMLISDKFAVTHVSTHVPMAEAVTLVQKERVHTVIRLTHQALSRLHASPRIAVAGLNPHAGEHGAFGSEDAMEILPAIEAARALGWDVVGPEPPDTVFYRASKGLFDAVVCMYHDQGHIPMKLLDFEGGVNVTLGLQVVRTSVDHGTAFDIAWQGKASTHSFVQAYRFAQKLGA